MYREDQKKILSSLACSAGLVISMWVVHWLIFFFQIDKTALANIPRKVNGLIGILTSPWVHDDLKHLFLNTGPLFFFTAATLYFYRKTAARAIAGIWLLSGIWVWWLADIGSRSGAHIGVSGVAYGLGAFLFFSGIFRRDSRSMTLSLVIAIFYGGMMWGIFPGQTGISWESHLFGALAGIGMAWVYRKVDVFRRKRYKWEDDPEHEPQDAHATWNYRQNWPGSQEIFIPGESNSSDTLHEK